MRQRVLVTGASGQLAGAIATVFGRDSDVTALARTALDITDDRAVNDAVAVHRPDLVVNCAAYNDVDGAETDPVAALEVNAFAVRGLARATAAAGATLVHYSSDFVFDGTASRPYTEDDRPNPQGVYAASKLLGEWFALEAGKAVVLRVESLFGAPSGRAGRTGSLGSLVAGIEAGREVPVFVDRTVSPSVRLRRCRGDPGPDGVGHGVGRLSLRECRVLQLARHCHGDCAAARNAGPPAADHARHGLAACAEAQVLGPRQHPPPRGGHHHADLAGRARKVPPANGSQ